MMDSPCIARKKTAPSLVNANPAMKLILETGREVESFLERFWSARRSSAWLRPDVRRHLVSEVGLRVRPHLLRLSAECGNIEFRDLLSIAGGIELLQVSTLVIDDVLDKSSRRNNLASLFSDYGPELTVCIGAIVSSNGFALIASGIAAKQRLLNGTTLMRMMSECHADIYAGQFADLQNQRNTSVTEREFIDVISMTTASFIRTSLVGGAVLWGAPKDLLKVLDEIGRALGIAYQIRDDIIDIIGISDYTGKPVGGDIKQCKMRLPAIRALETLKGKDRHKLKSILTQRTVSASAIREATSIIKNSGAIGYCIKKTREYCGEVAEQVESLPGDFVDLKAGLLAISELLSCFHDTAEGR